MTPILTTITAYWQRPEMLCSWVKAIRNQSPAVRHLVYFVGEAPPDWWAQETAGSGITGMVREEKPGLSIGHYHNLGAEQADTEWIMKIDVDTLPSANYFKELLPILGAARPREWFNGGMLYMNKHCSATLLADANLPLSLRNYTMVMTSLGTYSASSYLLPAATNFICRRDDYLELGGCDPRFRGYGWEDYQQIHMLETHWLQRSPLGRGVTIENATLRCRDLSRRKARELWHRNSWLCLMHKWHPGGSDPTYRSSMNANRAVLLERVQHDQQRMVKHSG